MVEGNLISLHTIPGCAMPEEAPKLVSAILLHDPAVFVAGRNACRKKISTNCGSSYAFVRGCGTQARHPGSYGKDFNSGRGGPHALAQNKDYGADDCLGQEGCRLSQVTSGVPARMSTQTGRVSV